jgi:hypothetical protein
LERICSIPDCNKRHRYGGLCDMHASRQRRHGDPLHVERIVGDDAARFWVKVNKNGPVPEHRPELGPCWLWTGGTYPSGYGEFWLKSAGRPIPAHHFAYKLLVGPIPEGLEPDHLCYVRPCVRALGHLEPVTRAENSRRGWEHHHQHTGPRLRDSSGRFVRRQP